MPSEFYDSSSLAYCGCDDFYRTLPLPSVSAGVGGGAGLEDYSTYGNDLGGCGPYFDYDYDPNNPSSVGGVITTTNSSGMFTTFTGGGGGSGCVSVSASNTRANGNFLNDCNNLGDNPLTYNEDYHYDESTRMMAMGPLSLPLNLNRSPRGT